ncbi:GAF domain-containing protein [Wenjunlia vitaminophila]|nr:GAF domain-containing protein [Wenjunlia vitaminophila]
MGSRRWVLSRGTVVAGFLSVLSYTASIVAGLEQPTWLLISVIGAGSLAVVFTIVLSARDVRTAEQAAHQAAAEQRRALQEMLVPLVHTLGEVAARPSARERERLQQRMKSAVVGAARIIGPENTRACLLEIAGPPGGRVLSCPTGLWFGRQEAPRAVFCEGEPRGDRLLRHMDQRRPLFVPDMELEPPEQRTRSRTYRTCIAAAVAPSANHEAFGLLTLDSPEAGDLTEEDIKIVEILGQLLGAALAIK